VCSLSFILSLASTQYSGIFFLDFSVALSRGSFTQNDQDLGYLAFGGIAPVSTTTPTVTVPVQGYTVSTGSDEVFMYYTVDIDSYIFDGSTSLTGTEKQAILDTGSTLNSLPTDVAKAYNAQFVPPATLDQVSNVYLVDCNANVPKFEVEIGGSSFSIDSKDQILPAGTDTSGNKICQSAIQDGGDPSDPRSQFVLCVPPIDPHFNLDSCFALMIVPGETRSFIMWS